MHAGKLSNVYLNEDPPRVGKHAWSSRQKRTRHPTRDFRRVHANSKYSPQRQHRVYKESADATLAQALLGKHSATRNRHVPDAMHRMKIHWPSQTTRPNSSCHHHNTSHISLHSPLMQSLGTAAIDRRCFHGWSPGLITLHGIERARETCTSGQHPFRAKRSREHKCCQVLQVLVVHQKH